ncbi:MAG TPA: hypothetical protein VEJ18_21870, partial [Planctomycetota bacterium]|nr:hypothetical protein [Planctomycetota bacterium]
MADTGERGTGGAGRTLLREWPLLGAAVALLSALLLPSWFPSRAALDASALGEALARLEAGDPAGAEAAGRTFLASRPGSPRAPAVKALVARALVEQVRRGARPPRPALPEAWAMAAADLELARNLARMMAEYGLAPEAVVAWREISARDPGPETAFALALALAAQAAAEGSRALLEEALETADRASAALPSGERVRAVVLRARLSRIAGRAADALPEVVSAMEAFADPADRARLQLERGRILVRLDRPAEALAALDLAGEGLKGDPAELRLARVELYARHGRPEALAIADGLVREKAREGPLARVVAEAGRLASDPVAFEAFASALAELPDPGALAGADVDADWVVHAAREAVEAAAEPAALRGADAAFAELARLRPTDARLALDAARALRRMGDLLRARDAAAAAARHREAGEAYARAARAVDGPALREAAREGAEAFARAGAWARAAEMYGLLYDLDPERHAEALFRRAEALRHAGLWASAGSDRPGALEAYEACLLRVAPGDPAIPGVLLGKGLVLERIGRLPEAAVAYRRVLTEDLGASPLTREWEAALLGAGRVALERALEGDAGREAHLAEARARLSEYLERYAAEGDVRAGAVEAAWRLGRAALEAGDREAALAAFVVAARLPAADASARGLQADARFLRADLLYALGR